MAVYTYYNPNQNNRVEEARNRLMGIMEQRQQWTNAQHQDNQRLQAEAEEAQRKAEDESVKQHHTWASTGMNIGGAFAPGIGHGIGALIGGLLGTGMEMKARNDLAQERGRGSYSAKNFFKDLGATHGRLPSEQEAMNMAGSFASFGGAMKGMKGAGDAAAQAVPVGQQAANQLGQPGSVQGLQGPAGMQPAPKFSASAPQQQMAGPYRPSSQPTFSSSQQPPQTFGQTSQFGAYYNDPNWDSRA